MDEFEEIEEILRDVEDRRDKLARDWEVNERAFQDFHSGNGFEPELSVSMNYRRR